MVFFRLQYVLMLLVVLLQADAKKLLEMSEKLDKLDAQEISFILEKADECTYRRDFYCTASYHEKAHSLATTTALKGKLQASIALLDREKERVYQEKRAKEQEEEEQREREILERQRMAQAEEDAYNQTQLNMNMSNYMMQQMNQTNPFNQSFNRQVPKANTYIPSQNRNNSYTPQTQTTPNYTTQRQYNSSSSTQQTTQQSHVGPNTQKQSNTTQISQQAVPPSQNTPPPVTSSQQTFTPIIKNDVSYDYGLSYEQSQTWCKRKADELRSWDWSPHKLISIGECSCSLGKNSVANDSNMLQKEYRCELKYVWQKNSPGGSR